MKKVTIFFSDLEGTFIHIKKNNDIDAENFIKSISQLNNNLIFSFASQCNYEILNENVNQIKPYAEKYNIVLGQQIYEGGYIEDNQNHTTNIISKLSQMLNYLKLMSKQYEIEKVYYAEDSDLTQYMFKELASNLGYNVDIITPSIGGCKDLTNIINKNYLNVKTKKKNYSNK